MNNNRIIGYTIITAVLLLLVLPAAYLYWQTTSPKTKRTIIFKHVTGQSFLSKQDPVRILGVEVGVVTKITGSDTAAFVTIETDPSIEIHEGYKVELLPKGVMGERFLTISTGTPSRRMIPSATLLTGTVMVGPDEALSYVKLLADAIHKLRSVSDQLRFGTAQKTSLIEMTWQITLKIDSILGTLQSAVSGITNGLSGTIGTVSDLLETSSNLSASISDSLQTSIHSVTTLVEDTDRLLLRTQSLLNQVSALTEKVSDPDLSLWKENSITLGSQLRELQSLIYLLQSDSLVLPVKLW